MGTLAGAVERGRGKNHGEKVRKGLNTVGAGQEKGNC